MNVIRKMDIKVVIIGMVLLFLIPFSTSITFSTAQQGMDYARNSYSNFSVASVVDSNLKITKYQKQIVIIDTEPEIISTICWEQNVIAEGVTYNIRELLDQKNGVMRDYYSPDGLCLSMTNGELDDLLYLVTSEDTQKIIADTAKERMFQLNPAKYYPSYIPEILIADNSGIVGKVYDTKTGTWKTPVIGVG